MERGASTLCRDQRRRSRANSTIGVSPASSNSCEESERAAFVKGEPDRREEIDAWMTAPTPKALTPQRPLAGSALRIVARGGKADEVLH